MLLRLKGYAWPVPVESQLSADDADRDLPLLERADTQLIEAERPTDVSLWNVKEAVRGAANRELSGTLLESAVRRLAQLGLLGLVASAAFTLLAALLTPARANAPRGVAMQMGLAVALLSGLLLWIARRPKLRPQHAVDLGTVYLFAVSLALAVLRHSSIVSDSELLRSVSPVTLPILVFGALIPSVPKKALVVLCVAALMDPLAMVLLGAHARYTFSEIVLLLASPALSAALAYQISRVVHHLTEGIVKAREVGSYKLVERLGVGGMAEVWRANHRMLRRPAAVKLIRPQVLIDHGPADSERLLRLFTREVRTTAALSSPHTIQVYDFGVTREGAFYYVMELLEGIDLQSLVERYGPQPAERIAHLMQQVCHSLREAHARDFVHRDVKPANILTCALGGEHDFVKVLDFGLVLDRHPTSQELEDEQRFVGTPAVMAPEMLRFQAPVDARADLYALGCVGYWLLTGKRVFEAATRHDMLVMHAHQKPILPSKRVEFAIHAGLESIVMQCLEKNPNKRPQTAKELAEALAGLRFEHAWSEERAELWWKQHRPSNVSVSALRLDSDGASAGAARSPALAGARAASERPAPTTP